MENDKYFYAYISRLTLINRWALMRNCRNENVAEHSMMTSVLAHALGLICNNLFNGDTDPDKMAVYALFHDSHEVLTGDMPTPIKYNNSSIKTAYKNVENEANQKLLDMLPDALYEDYYSIINYDESSYEGKLIKAADTLSAYIKCVEECSMGNTDFESALSATFEKLNNMALPEVEYYLKNFGDTFGKTIDQLN